MKKLSFALLALFLFTPIYIEAKKKTFGNGLYWDLDKYGNLEISGVGDMMNFSNSNPAPWHNKNCWYVTICEGVTSIGDYAFDGNFINKVLLPSTIQRIGRNAFYNSDINEIVLPESIVELNEYAFHKCQKLQKVVLSENLKVIPEYAFWDCDIREIQIPQSIISIGEGCFASNNNLKRVVLENENTELHKYAFGHSNEINRIQIMRRNRVQNCYWVEEGDKVGILTFNSKWIIPINNQYTDVQILNSEYIKVKNNENYGIISFRGKEIIPTSRGYTYISDYDSSKGTFAFTKKGVSGICDSQGREISTTRLAPTSDDIKANGGYASVMVLNNGNTKYYKVSKSGRYGLTDAEGKVIVPTEMEALESAGTGYLRYKLNGFWGVMNYAGKIIIDTDRGYTSIGDFKTFNKRFSYTMNGYKGECDATGRQISKIKVDTPRPNTSVVSSSGSSSSSSSSNNNSGNNTTTVVVEHKHDPVPMQVWKQCTGCYGSGMCQSGCGGSGWFTGYSGNSTRCIGCGGSGKCQFCAGQGGHYEVEYR